MSVLFFTLALVGPTCNFHAFNETEQTQELILLKYLNGTLFCKAVIHILEFTKKRPAIQLAEKEKLEKAYYSFCDAFKKFNGEAEKDLLDFLNFISKIQTARRNLRERECKCLNLDAQCLECKIKNIEELKSKTDCKSAAFNRQNLICNIQSAQSEFLKIKSKYLTFNLQNMREIAGIMKEYYYIQSGFGQANMILFGEYDFSLLKLHMGEDFPSSATEVMHILEASKTKLEKTMKEFLDFSQEIKNFEDKQETQCEKLNITIKKNCEDLEKRAQDLKSL